jgi:hypothetical protein
MASPSAYRRDSRFPKPGRRGGKSPGAGVLAVAARGGSQGRELKKDGRIFSLFGKKFGDCTNTAHKKLRINMKKFILLLTAFASLIVATSAFAGDRYKTWADADYQDRMAVRAGDRRAAEINAIHARGEEVQGGEAPLRVAKHEMRLIALCASQKRKGTECRARCGNPWALLHNSIRAQSPSDPADRTTIFWQV